MTKEPTRTIYNCLGKGFWTSRKCHTCHTFFTNSDYAQKNYQLTFLEVLIAEQYCLAVIIQLTHKTCCSDCISYRQDLYQTKPKTHVPKT